MVNPATLPKNLPTTLFAAPHRALFLIGIVQLVAIMLWWMAMLSGIYFGTFVPSYGNIPLALFHAPILIYLVLPPLFFGFLLTVFPRWMGYPDLQRLAYAPVATGYALASFLCWSALLFGNDGHMAGAFGAAFLACLWGVGALTGLALRERRDGKGPTWHGWSILAAFAFGITGQLALLAFLYDPASAAVRFANPIGLWAFVLPVFLTVCHRMIPFFAGNAVEGYVRWRPFWPLAVCWCATLLLLAGLLSGIGALHVTAAVMLCFVTAFMSWKWWPRAPAPALLMVLVIGFAWAPAGYALAAATGIGFPLGRASEHALTIGFVGSLLIAMVTRVTQGHSGRPLALPVAGWVAFGGLQAAAVARIVAAFRAENGFWLVCSAGIFVLALLPWVARNMTIYLTPRKDGKPG